MLAFVTDQNRIPGYNEVRLVGTAAIRPSVRSGDGSSQFHAAILFGLAAVTPLWMTLAYLVWR